MAAVSARSVEIPCVRHPLILAAFRVADAERLRVLVAPDSLPEPNCGLLARVCAHLLAVADEQDANKSKRSSHAGSLRVVRLTRGLAQWALKTFAACSAKLCYGDVKLMSFPSLRMRSKL